MQEPIKIKTRKAVEYKEEIEEWTYEKILELFPDGGDNLVNPLVRRCQKYEEEIEQLTEEIEYLKKSGRELERAIAQMDEEAMDQKDKDEDTRIVGGPVSMFSVDYDEKSASDRVCKKIRQLRTELACSFVILI